MAVEAADLAKRKQAAIEIAKSAGNGILEHFNTDIAVTQKDDDTPLTIADLAANELIITRLTELFPATPILTEESCTVSLQERKSWATYWLVDPLDGTREFVKHNGEFSVNIALIHNGAPVLGVVHAPVLEITYWATSAGGAWKQTGDSKPRKIMVRNAPQEKVTVALGWASQFSPAITDFLEKLGDHSAIRMGGALKSCLVAEGRADIYPCLGPTGEWDTAAAQCIVEEAGGQVTDTQLQRLRYNTKDSLLNPYFFVQGTGNHHWPDFL